MSLTDNHIFELDENVTRKSMSYKNRFGITISADLYRPKDFDESQEHPAIIVGAPYGGVKEQGPGIYAQNLALRGFVALTFDPSYNGYSGGEPRHLSSPDLFVEDFGAAVDYLGTRPFVDRERIGVIGICGSGGVVVGDHAHSRYFSEDAYEQASEPKELYVVPNAGHVDLYDKTDLIPLDKLEAFFTENLAAGSRVSEALAASAA